MESLQEAYIRLMKDKVFRKEGFLCSVFVMANPKEIFNQSWQFDFYQKEKDCITSYKMDAAIGIVNEGMEVFREEKIAIEELRLDEIKIPFETVVKELQAKVEKSHQSATKIIVILQKASVPIWNISILTDAFNLINVKMNAVTKEVIDEKSFSMLSWKT